MTLAEFIMRVSLLLSVGKQACGWRDRNATNEQEVCSPALSLSRTGGLNARSYLRMLRAANLAGEEEERRDDLCLHLLLQRDEERE